MGGVPPMGSLGLPLGGDERQRSISPDSSIGLKESDAAAIKRKISSSGRPARRRLDENFLAPPPGGVERRFFLVAGGRPQSTGSKAGKKNPHYK